MKVYGIPNCNTVKKGVDWLKSNKLQFEFHDYKKKGISQEKLKEWCKYFGWEKLLNKKGTTWRGLPAEQQLTIINEEAAIQLMIEKPSMIKRPLIEAGEKLLLGFEEKEYEEALIKYAV